MVLFHWFWRVPGIFALLFYHYIKQDSQHRCQVHIQFIRYENNPPVSRKTS